MTPNFTKAMAVIALIIIIGAVLSSCTQSLAVLDGSTHACGNVHVEGTMTDTQGDIVIVKAPTDWTPEQINEFCDQGK